MKTHKQIRVKVGSTVAQIDKGIAPLIREVWNAFIETEESCQGKDGNAFIHFTDVPDFKKFMSVVAASEEVADGPWSDLYLRAFRCDPEKEGSWMFHLDIDDRRVDREEPPTIEFGVGLIFPSKDIPELVKRFKKVNSWRTNDKLWRKTP
jgi:hypothetical protein